MSKLNLTRQHNRTATLVRLVALAVLTFALVTVTTVARADSSSTYSISGTTTPSGTFSGTLDFSYSSATNQTVLINSNFTMDGTSFSCNGVVGGNKCLVFDPSGTDYFQVVSGNMLAVLDWSQFNPAGNFPPTFNFSGGYLETINVAITNTVTGGKGTLVATPEPSALFLLGAGLLGLVVLSRRRSNLNSIA